MRASSAIRTGLRRLIIIAMAMTITALTATSAAATTEVIDRIVAQVNDEIITQYELEQAAMMYLIEHGRSPMELAEEDGRDELLEEVLDHMINRILIEEEAEELGLEVTDQQIEEWIGMTAQQQNLTTAQFRQLIGRQGIDYEDYRQIVRDNLLRLQLMQVRAQGRTSVSDEEVRRAYREHFGGDPEGKEQRLEIRHILLVPDQTPGGEQAVVERLEELKAKIVAGEATFEELAREESQGPGAQQGGNIGTFGRGELAASFERAAFAQEVGVVSEPVETEFGYHLIEIVSVEEAEVPEVDQRMEQIRAHLIERELERSLDSYLETVRSRAFVNVRY